MPDLIETGMEPEFLVTDLAWAELVQGNQMIRLCFAIQKHGHMIAQYTCVVATTDLVKMIKTAGEVVAKQGGLLAFVSEADSRAH